MASGELGRARRGPVPDRERAAPGQVGGHRCADGAETEEADVHRAEILSGANAASWDGGKLARPAQDGRGDRARGKTLDPRGAGKWTNFQTWAPASSTSTSTRSSSKCAGSGMPIAQAVRLCPQATFFQGAFTAYRDASRAVRAVLERFSPTVVMASLDEAYLDFGGTERLHPVSLLPVAEQVRDEVRRDAGLDCSIGIGPNRMIAKLASDAAKPRGLMEVRAGWEEGFLAGLPLKAMPGVGPKTAARWVELGLADVWQIQQMEEPALERLIGPEARALKRRVHGYGGTTLQGGRLPRSVSRETTLSRDLRDPATLERTLSLLTARVAGQLRDEHLVA